MGLTGAPPPLPPVLAATGTTAEGNFLPAIIGILDARSPDRLASSIADVLHAASGPGNIVTGRVTELRPDGTVFLETSSGIELSFRHPPEVPLQLGSTVTLRLVATVPVPQAMLLAVDGRTVAGLLARAAAGRPAAADITAAPSLPPSVNFLPSGARATGPSDFGIGISSQLVATFADEEAVAGDAIGPARGNGNTSLAGVRSSIVSDPMVATLLRASAPRPGATPPPVGTRYLLTIDAVADPSAETDSSAVPAAGARETSSSQASTASPEGDPPATGVPLGARSPPVDTVSPSPLDRAQFTAQTAVLAGRVIAARDPAEVLIETGIGTLILPLPATSLAVGSAVQLKVVAFARPPGTDTLASGAAADQETSSSSATGPTVPQTAIQEALEVLTNLRPPLAEAAQALFVLPPGATLAALIFAFLGTPRGDTARRWTESPARAALDAVGREDLKERLDSDADVIGIRTPPTRPEDWSVTVLPYLGTATVQPGRLYHRAIEGTDDEDAAKSTAAAQRFVIEIELQRLGPLQFDGLVRDRRFDLALRTAHPLEPDLQSQIHAIFRETIGIGGYAGELAFGKLGRFPLLPQVSAQSGHELNV